MIDELLNRATQLADAGKLEDALQAVIGFVRVVNENPACAGQVYESADLDRLCRHFAGKIVQPVAKPADFRADVQFYIATELYAAGGHTRVLHDFIAAQPQRRHMILLTDLLNRVDRKKTEAQFAGAPVEILWAPLGPVVEKLSWLVERLMELSNQRIFLFHHHEDAVAVTACEIARPRRLHFCHHADHHLSLGLHLPCEVHVDLTPFSFYHCRDQVGLKNVVYLPITTPRLDAREPASFIHGSDSEHFVTCAAGNEGKFSAPYDFDYFRLLVARLSEVPGSHLHIGPLSEARIESIRGALASRGISSERFRHIAHVPSLAAAMGQENVSLYLGSWPIGGARGLLEVLASGTPTLGHINYEHEFLGCQCLLPLDAPKWRRPEEFIEQLKSFSPADLQRLSAENRQHWETFHREELLALALAQETLPACLPPPQPSYEPDRLRSYLARNGDRDVLLQMKALRVAELKNQILKEKLRKERQTLKETRERLAQVRAERDEAKRSLATKLRLWIFGQNKLRKNKDGTRQAKNGTPGLS